MSDLISREALLVFIDNNFRSYWDYQTVQEFFNIITNAPAIEQGEAVGVVVNDLSAYTEVFVDFGDGKEPPPDETKLYTTPQQPQSVADVLEDVKRLVLDEKIAVSYQSIDGYRSSLLCAIRALIKRNA